MFQRAIASYRVSTQRQGRSGLGIEAQRNLVERFAEGGMFELIREFVEIETGKGADALDRRPRLAEALATAKREHCQSSSPSWTGSRVTSPLSPA